MPKVLLVSYHFPPSSAIGAQRAGRLARLLPDFGYEVDVICASLTRAEGHLDPSQLHLVPDHSRLRRVDTPWVLGRNPHDPPGAGHRFGRIAWKARAYAEWLLLTHDWSWNWGESARRQFGSSLLRTGYDALIAEAPPNFSVVPIIRAARKQAVPIILDLRDVWAFGDESYPPWWPVSPTFRRLRWTLRLRDEAVRASWHVVLSSPDAVDVMRARFPDLAASHFSLIYNAYEAVDSSQEMHPDVRTPERLRLVYTGSLAYGRAEQVKRLILGIEAFRRRGEGDVELVLAGDGGTELLQLARAEGYGVSIEDHGPVDREEAVKLQQGAGALLLLQPTARMEVGVAIPGKLFEYMARRRPIFAMVGSGPAGRIIQEHGLGVVALDERPEPLAEALRQLTERIRTSPRLPPPPARFSEESTVAEFARTLDRVLGAC